MRIGAARESAMRAAAALMLIASLTLSGCISREPVKELTFAVTAENGVFGANVGDLSPSFSASFMKEVSSHWNAPPVKVRYHDGEIFSIVILSDSTDFLQNHYLSGYGHGRSISYHYTFRGVEATARCETANHANGAIEHFFGASQENDAPGHVLLPPDIDDVLRQLAHDIYNSIF
jgi:hypothetical protein